MVQTPGIRGVLAALALVLSFLAAPEVARAQAPAPVAGSWGAQLESMAQWMAQRNATAPCTEHCFVLTRMRLTGAADGEMHFVLEGAVLADRSVAVPLFGPPTQAHIESVTEGGKPAALGFEQDHWFVLTAARHFVIEGVLTLQNDLALTLPGPLDALDAELTRGRVVEGAHLSGLANVTVHFDRDATASPAEEPPVFQLSRAVRIGRETTFEYRLVMRSGKDLGVVRLPLSFGERVLDVQGSSGWTLQGHELVLPTAGRSAQVTISGALTAVTRLEPDPRSTYEWWLVESDAEHRLTVKGDARQIDASQSPIARTQPSGRLFMVARGQHIDVDAQALVATEALAAVVREHDRTLVLTARGDLVADDVLSYENDGIDWLAWPPTGKAVYLATDGTAQQVMRATDGAGEVLVPLRVGSHSVHLQSMGTASIGALGGWLTVPTPTHALATSRTNLTIGLPSNVHPIAVLGGDRPWLAFHTGDALALAVSLGIALLGLRGGFRRALGAIALGGLWLVAPSVWELGLVAAAVWVAVWAAARLLPPVGRVAAWGGIGLVALVVCVVLAAGSSPARDTGGAVRDASQLVPTTTVTTPAVPASPSASPTADDLEQQLGVDGKVAVAKEAFRGGTGSAVVMLGEMNSRQVADQGVVQGVAPVALPLPAYDRHIVIRRELVTRDRPLSLGLVYVTTTGLAPLVALWLACIAWLARLHAGDLAHMARALRERLARKTDVEPVAPAPAAPPPVVA